MIAELITACRCTRRIEIEHFQFNIFINIEQGIIAARSIFLENQLRRFDYVCQKIENGKRIYIYEEMVEL